MRNDLIKNYINKVTKNMGSKQRDEVFKELTAHILDSADALADEKKVDVDDDIIQEIIRRMGPAEDLAAMYPEDKTVSDKILDHLIYLGKFTGLFIVICIIMNIVLTLLFGPITLNGFILVCFVIYVVLLVIHLIRYKLLPKILDR